MKWIPNSISLLNLIIGCIAVAIAFGGDLYTAAILTLLCSILDFLDGATARWLNAGSETGKQLDALADLISFGLTPAVVMFIYISNSLYEVNQSGIAFVLSSPAFLITAMSALRLARFSADTEDKSWFTGLPTPANALLIVSVPFVLGITVEGAIHSFLEIFIQSTPALLIVVLLLSFLLVAPVRMFSLKVRNFGWKDNRIRYIFLACCILLLITFGLSAAPLFLIFYIILSLFDNFARFSINHKTK